MKLLSNVVIVYMLVALAWWSYLLYIKNNDAFLAKAELAKMGMAAEGIITSGSEFYQTTAYKDLEKSYKRQEWMIFGEGAVFVFILIVGLWLINRGYHREVQAANQSRNFLLSITHELKSPLAGIRLVLETFQKRKLDAAQTDRMTLNALRETDRLSDLVNNLLLAARLAGTYQPAKEPVHLYGLLASIVKTLEQRHPEAIFEMPDHGPRLEIMADKMGMVSVFTNILENAIKYSDGPAQISLYIEAEGPRAKVRISDQGIGIPKLERDKIFSQFYRIGNEDTRKTKGTGLGLYIAKEIVEAHHGKIKAEANQPKGATFSVLLPV